MLRLIPCAVLMAASSYADVIPDPRGTARSVEPFGENVPVAMKWEVVDLFPALDRMDVTAVFGLVNTGSRDLPLDVGFPELRGQRLHDFRVETDNGGRPVPVRAIEPVKPRSSKPANLPEWVSFRGYDRYLSWRMDFPRGEERRVTVRYWVAPDTDGPGGRPRRIAPGEAALPPQARDPLPLLTTGYILHTGSLWAGPIGRAVVRIHYSDAFPKALVRDLRPPRRNWRLKTSPPNPWRYDEKERTDTLILNDVEPTWQHDIEIDYKKVTVAEEIALLVKAMKEGTALPPDEIERTALLVEGLHGSSIPAAPADREQMAYVYERITAGLERDLQEARRSVELHLRFIGPLCQFSEEGWFEADSPRQRFLRTLVALHQASGDAARTRETAGRRDRVLAASAEFWDFKAETLEKWAARPATPSKAAVIVRERIDPSKDETRPPSGPEEQENARRLAAECRGKADALRKERQSLAPLLNGNTAGK